MRFRDNLMLQKQQAEQSERKEEFDRIFVPIRNMAHQYYITVQAWNDPLAASLARIRAYQRTEGVREVAFDTTVLSTSVPSRPSS